MLRLLWSEPECGRQRAVQAAAASFLLVVCSTMFFSLTALTRIGADYDCGPAAFALVAGPDRQTDQIADCQRAASQRLTTVVGLAVLAIAAGAVGTRLFEPARYDDPTSQTVHGELLPSDQVQHRQQPSRGYPYVDRRA